MAWRNIIGCQAQSGACCVYIYMCVCACPWQMNLERQIDLLIRADHAQKIMLPSGEHVKKKTIPFFWLSILPFLFVVVSVICLVRFICIVFFLVADDWAVDVLFPGIAFGEIYGNPSIFYNWWLKSRVSSRFSRYSLQAIQWCCCFLK